jgi:hypothetical protein
VYLAHPRGDVFGKEIYSSIYRVLRGRRKRRTGEAHASWYRGGQETRRGLRAARVSRSTTLAQRGSTGNEAEPGGRGNVVGVGEKNRKRATGVDASASRKLLSRSSLCSLRAYSHSQ